MAAGDLDASFAGNGKKRIGFGGDDQANAVLVQPNGRIVVAGLGTAARRFCVGPPARQRQPRHRVRVARQARDPLRGRRRGRVRRGAAAGRQDRARGRLGLPRRGRAPEPERLARHHVLRRREGAVQLGRDQPRHGRARAAERQAAGRRLLGTRGRQRPARATESERGARHDVRHRRQGRRSTSAATTSARRWRGRPTGASSSPAGRRPPARSSPASWRTARSTPRSAPAAS